MLRSHPKYMINALTLVSTLENSLSLINTFCSIQQDNTLPASLHYSLNVHQHHPQEAKQHFTTHAIKMLFFLPTVCDFFSPLDHIASQDLVNKFQTISGIEIYWQRSNEPVCLPAQLRASHCPECSEHMLLSCAACLTAKGWFNYINCLMTEERAAGPCMLVCDKRGNSAVPRPSLCK